MGDAAAGLAGGRAGARGRRRSFVDDAAVETPGTCHLENWIMLTGEGGNLVNSAPTCARKAWPNLEIGGFVTHGWARDGADTLVGLSPKLALRSEERGLGIGIATSLGYGIDRGWLEARLRDGAP